MAKRRRDRFLRKNCECNAFADSSPGNEAEGLWLADNRPPACRFHAVRTSGCFRRVAGALALFVVAALVVLPATTGCDGRPTAESGTDGADDNVFADAGHDAAGARAAETGYEGATPTLAVETVELTEGRICGNLRVSGRVSGVREANIVSETQGRVESVEFDLGARVERGDVLVRMDDRVEAAALEQAREQLEAARADLGSLERRADSGSVSRSDLTNARAAARGTESNYEQARRTYSNRTIVAPFSGRVAVKEAAASEGNYLNAGTRVARIVDMERLRLEAPVGARNVRNVTVGASATIELPACDGPVFAEVVAIAAGSDADTGSFIVALEWENSCGDAVRSGMAATAEIECPVARGGIVLPTAALGAGGEGLAVFVVEDGRVSQREVELRARLGARAIVETGVELGEEVVISAVSRLRDGDPVRATRIGESGELQ